ncbi:hypothetical protein KCP69_14380 [Salmonella enterica subsp. enterica]|nr:hypothetical protein KCP69_14380 [Salmonella enterica subsp. enterica]
MDASPSADVEKALTKQFGWSKTEITIARSAIDDYSLKTPADTGGGTIAVISPIRRDYGWRRNGNVGGVTSTVSQIRDARLRS